MSFKSNNETGRTIFLRVRESALNKGLVSLPYQLGAYTFNPGCEVPETRGLSWLSDYPEILEKTDKLVWNGDCKVVPVFYDQRRQPGVEYYSVETDLLTIKRRELEKLEKELKAQSAESEVEKLGSESGGTVGTSTPSQEKEVREHIAGSVSGKMTQKAKKSDGAKEVRHVMD